MATQLRQHLAQISGVDSTTTTKFGGNLGGTFDSVFVGSYQGGTPRHRSNAADVAEAQGMCDVPGGHPEPSKVGLADAARRRDLRTETARCDGRTRIPRTRPNRRPVSNPLRVQ